MEPASLFSRCPVLGKKQVGLGIGQVEDLADVVSFEADAVDLIGELFREAHLHGDHGSKGRTCIAEVIELRIVMPFIPEL